MSILKIKQHMHTQLSSAQLSSAIRGLNFVLGHHLCPDFMTGSSEGSGRSCVCAGSSEPSLLAELRYKWHALSIHSTSFKAKQHYF